MFTALKPDGPLKDVSNSPKPPIRLLFIEDSENDVLLLLQRFRNAGYAPIYRQVASEVDMRNALEQERWDLILCDHNLPGFSAQAALRLTQELALDLPFIIVSGVMQEDDAIAAMRAGAHDYLSKNKLDRLVPAVERELREVCNRREKRFAEQTLRQSEARLRALTDNIPGVVFQMGYSTDGMLGFQYLSEAATMLFGISAEELTGSSAGWMTWLLDDDLPGFVDAAALSADNLSTLNWEGRIQLPTGEQKWINLRSSPRLSEANEVVWEGVMWNITHSKRVEADLRESRSQLAALSNHLQRIKEDERERIARDVHDVLGGTLVAMKFEMSLLESKLESDPIQARDRTRNVGRMVDDAIATVGRVTRELRPGILKDFGLAAAIESQGEDFAQRTGIACNILCTDHDLDPDYDTALAFFRVFQEALTNVSKHARATAVNVRLMQEGDEVVLEIADNGCGLGVSDLQKPRSFGLRGIRERLSSLGGRLDLSPVEPSGMRLILHSPLRPAHAEEHPNDNWSHPR
ncbi:response regulator [Zoogloea oleivorans]|jgi:PAS domain S-box-containing protein|uniref:Response regulator n=2 Tax=Zoogloea TaxID=349 RepID=A0A6C2D6C6_9RHOO|nr:histidine kinase [Zoogloea oleivorans]MBT9499378.1 response regulator [Zoogloea sp.]TYC61323.1 response regulator [Zoogloea oleivorans]